ncbi:MAG: hypothetical protein IJ945_09100 [Oscillospiraceae bacterium]|nr:hypothetical protein [Oscillospiraceae bacterium]
MLFKKTVFVCLVLSLLAFAFAGCGNILPAEEPESDSSEEIEYTEDYYDRLFFGDVISDETIRENIFAALTEININTEFIKDFSKAEDENGAEKFTFMYRENPFTVYMNPDSTVSSVRIGEDGTDVYLEGYEPYNADDYLVTEGIIGGFKHSLINAVEVAFDYPAVYEFASDWNYKHEGDFYYAEGTVLIGEGKKEHYMSMVRYYEEAENTMHWYSLYVDGNSLSFEKVFEEPEIAEREKISGE